MYNIHLWDALNHWYQEKHEVAQHQHLVENTDNENCKHKSLPKQMKQVALAIAQLLVK